jgi:Uma2 family endonuclease
MSTTESTLAAEPEPAWDVARLFPPQGYWTEVEYLRLTNSTNRLIEFTDGQIEVLPVPTEMHQLLVRYLVDRLREFVDPRGLGTVLFAPLRVQVRKGRFREPDVLFMLAEHSNRREDAYWKSPDLLMEVVSPDPESHQRDYDEKTLDYAEGKVSEYWIVDPQQEKITVLTLVGNEYAVHGEFGPVERATSKLLDGFAVEISAVFAAGTER